MNNVVTLVGNVTAEPEMRFTNSGKAVANFSIGVSHRFKNDKGDWDDKLDGFFRCTAWGDLAENVVASVHKGTRVVVTGKLKSESFTDQGGAKRTSFGIEADDVGLSLRWNAATVTKTARESNGQSTTTDGDWVQPEKAKAEVGT
jgi:single-strand DNA-binding protein